MSETAIPSSAATEVDRHALRAVILAGGLTFEREVSLSSGTQVWEELVRAGVDAEIRDADAGLLPGLAAAPADAVFIALHGATGEDGALRAVLDLAGVPYVGSPAAACRLARVIEAELDLHSTFDAVDTGTFRIPGLARPGHEAETIVGPANSDTFEDDPA